MSFVSMLAMIASSRNGGSAVAAPRHAPVTVTRIYTGSDSRTHAELIDEKLTPLAGREQSEKVKVASSYFVRCSPGFVADWHPASARRYVVTLSGRGELELAGGRKIPLGPGQILQAEDLTGKGHIIRTIGKTDWTTLFVQFDE
jgi:quercetin dioxygenase-like cupin family protein